MSERVVRIGGASGFWGDSSVAVPQLLRRGDVDYLSFDYLAELTMSILARARAKDPAAGWATDFVTVAMWDALPEIVARGIRVVTNAGGVNPRACAAALAARARDLGVALSIAIVDGDDVSALVPALRAAGTRALDGGALPERLASANAYLGAFPVAAALAHGAQVVITGRCVDSALPLGALIHEFGWTSGDYDRLAGGSLAGHIIECGAQGAGGLHTDWERVERWDDIGYPIVACASDGSFVATKAPGTGGLVEPATIAEQMLYEIGDPAAYVLPDVVCDFSRVTMRQDGPDRVRVAGALGRAPTATYKACATHVDGLRCTGMLTIVGIDAGRKASRTADAILARTRRIFAERGMADYRATHVETLGAEAVYGPHARTAATREVVLRLVVEHDDKLALEIFAREIAPAGTSWAPGTTGAGGGRPAIAPVVRLVSFLISKHDVRPQVELDGVEVPFDETAPPANVAALRSASETVRAISSEGEPHPEAPSLDGRATNDPAGGSPAADPYAATAFATEAHVEVPLVALAWARSGDKGDTANIGVIARTPALVPVLRAELTEARVAAYFAHLVRGRVRRYDVPGIGAFNFTLEEALGGGGMASMRVDPLAKGFAQMLLDLLIAVPVRLVPASSTVSAAWEPRS